MKWPMPEAASRYIYGRAHQHQQQPQPTKINLNAVTKQVTLQTGASSGQIKKAI
jgi:hypothetical protein